jgi:tripartite-type tricarboxylate transporter receptor subunit TctC
MKLYRRRFTLTCLLGLLLAGGTARAQTDYPSKPVRIISDSAPGSAVDVGLRIIADGLSQHSGQQVIVENRPGAGGAISAKAAAGAPPDGYTLYAPAFSVFLAVPGKAPNLPLVLPRDFLPVGYTVDQPIAIGVSPELGVNTLSELIALAKKRPGEISYGVTGVGRLTHLTGELLQIRADIKLQMVPYTGGSAHALSDALGGRIGMVIEGYTGLAGAFQSGQLKPLRLRASSACPTRPICRRWPRPFRVLSPPAGRRWWCRMAHPRRSSTRRAPICAPCWSSRKSRISSPHAARSCAR